METTPLADVRARRAWKLESGSSDLEALDGLVDGRWNGPIVISMPRTGSTLLGSIFLLLPDGSGGHAFERYIHEPVAPVFWEGRTLAESIRFFESRLGSADIVQESAYQFASVDIATWFLRQARAPISFVMRHPQLAWPSRWRIMIREWLSSNPDHEHRDRLQAALDADDYSDLGDLLTTRVTQPDNGWLSFMDLIDVCDDEGLDFVIVDNARFRADPDRILGEMCARWGVSYDAAMTGWNDLSEAQPRVVMSDLALGAEYDWYYAGTLGSTGGIIREDRPLLPLDRFPSEFRGEVGDHLTIDQAVEWYEELLSRPETL